MTSHCCQNDKIFLTDEAYQIFRHPGHEISHSDEIKIKAAKKLEHLGFFELTERRSVVCVHPDEWNLSDAPDHECREIIHVSKNPEPYSEADHILCPRCGHEFYLSMSSKKVTCFYSLKAHKSAILNLFEKRMTEQGLTWQCLQFGFYYVSNCALGANISKFFAITDFLAPSFSQDNCVFFRFVANYCAKSFFELADVLCCRKMFLETFEPTRQQAVAHKSKIQLTIDQDLISFAGTKLVASNAEHQWNVMKFFLENGQSIFSLRQITNALERNGCEIVDPEQQIRRSINRIRERTETLGHSKDAVIKATKAGYQLNCELVQVLDIR